MDRECGFLLSRDGSGMSVCPSAYSLVGCKGRPAGKPGPNKPEQCNIYWQLGGPESESALRRDVELRELDIKYRSKPMAQVESAETE